MKYEINSNNQVVNFQHRWTPVYSGFTAAPTSTSTITTSVSYTSLIPVGTPLKYKISSTYYYGIVTAITSSLITISGAILGGTIVELYYGTPEMVVPVYINVNGKYADTSSTTVLATKNKTRLIWKNAPAWCCALQACHETAGNSYPPVVNLTVNSNAVSTDNSGNGLQQSSNTGYFVYNQAIQINTNNTRATFGSILEIVVSNSDGAASDLTLIAVFVLE